MIKKLYRSFAKRARTKISFKDRLAGSKETKTTQEAPKTEKTENFDKNELSQIEKVKALFNTEEFDDNLSANEIAK